MEDWLVSNIVETNKQTNKQCPISEWNLNESERHRQNPFTFTPPLVLGTVQLNQSCLSGKIILDLKNFYAADHLQKVKTAFKSERKKNTCI